MRVKEAPWPAIPDKPHSGAARGRQAEDAAAAAASPAGTRSGATNKNRLLKK
ncbi:hypothetical protein [Desulforamulus profundi]|uniref:hypothetical protein n=1 Tax=Desulforamulus profundi TaxID=1383067 RepID=UPI0015D4D762|nr:hypothetical protein [Desulforamulus profundi]